MSYVTARTTCRICGAADLASVIHLGDHALSGQFPAAGEPDPPRAPLHVVRCRACGLVQLEHSVDPELMFRSYSYRTSLTGTMRAHVKGLVEEAAAMLAGRQGSVCVAPRVLDIGGNDGWALECFPLPTGNRVLIDPSDVPVEYPGILKIKDFFPSGMILNRQFDLVLSVACFYDTDRPVEWAAAVRKVLAADGLWCVEVADKSTVLQNAAFDYFVHEHATLLSAADMNEVAKRSGLKVVRVEKSLSNGGSARYFLTHLASRAYAGNAEWNARVAALWSHGYALAHDDEPYTRFADRCRKLAGDLKAAVAQARSEGKVVHLLGASTKAGSVLQYSGLDGEWIEAAADRDPRKVGRRMPGTGIPVIHEDESRKKKDRVFLSTLPFREEILARERAAGTAGDILFFPSMDRVAL